MTYLVIDGLYGDGVLDKKGNFVSRLKRSAHMIFQSVRDAVIFVNEYAYYTSPDDVSYIKASDYYNFIECETIQANAVIIKNNIINNNNKKCNIKPSSIQ